jgi:hypothetical protein
MRKKNKKNRKKWKSSRKKEKASVIDVNNKIVLILINV